MRLVAFRGVLAGRYNRSRRGPREGQRVVTHAIEVDAGGWPTAPKTLCGRIREEFLADLDEPAATCPACLQRLAKGELHAYAEPVVRSRSCSSRSG